MKQSEHIFIISLMLACGIGFFLWGTVLHNKVEHPLGSQKVKRYKSSIAIKPMDESKIEPSQTSTFCVKPCRKAPLVNGSNHTKRAVEKVVYVSESEILGQMSEVAFLFAKPSLAVTDLNLILEDAILDSGIEERNIDERIGLSSIDSLFPLRKGNSYVSFPQKREPPAITIPFKTIAPESEQNSRIAGSSGHRKNKATTSKGKADGGSYSPPQKSGLRQHSDDELVFEAEDALSLTPYFEIGQDKYASNSKYISAPESGDSTALNGVGTAEYSFEVKKAGVYKVFGRVLAPTAGSDSFYIRMDNGPQYAWDLQESRDWVWEVATQGMGGSISDLTFELEAGSHILRIGNREDGTMLDILIILRLSN